MVKQWCEAGNLRGTEPIVEITNQTEPLRALIGNFSSGSAFIDTTLAISAPGSRCGTCKVWYISLMSVSFIRLAQERK